MNLLAIDTSTSVQVVGLSLDSAVLDRTETVGREHSQRILPAILAILDEAGIAKRDLDGIVFGQGPGSFTGLRIAVGVVQGLAYGLGIPVAPVSTLACLAQGERRRSGADHVVVATTARKTEVFFGSYGFREGFAELIGKEAVVEAAKAPVQTFDHCAGVGSGWEFRESLEAALGVVADPVVLDAMPTATDLLTLGLAAFERGATVPALEAQPQYLREQVAARPGSKD